MQRFAALLALALLLVALLQLAPPFTAVWQRPNVARLAWTQPAGVVETCVIRNTTLIGCRYNLAPGPTGLTLGDTGPIDATARPQAGDVFTLTMDNTTAANARLIGVVYLGVIRH